MPWAMGQPTRGATLQPIVSAVGSAAQAVKDWDEETRLKSNEEAARLYGQQTPEGMSIPPPRTGMDAPPPSIAAPQAPPDVTSQIPQPTQMGQPSGGMPGLYSERQIMAPVWGAQAKTVKELNEQERRNIEIARQGTELGIRQANAEAAYYQEAQRNAEEEERKYQEKAAEQQKAVEDADRNYNESLETSRYTLAPEQVKRLQRIAETGNPDERALAQRQLEKAQSIDPDRLLGESTGKRIASAIAIALGAYGAALTGGPNTALQIIDKATDDDIMSQREMLASGERRVTKARTALQDLRDRFKDDATASLARKAQIWEGAEKKALVFVAGLKGEDQKIKGQQLIESIRGQKEGILQQMRMSSAQTQSQIRATQNAAIEKAAAEKAKKEAETPTSRGMKWVGEGEPQKQGLPEFQKEISKAEANIGTIDDLTKRVQTEGVGAPGSDWAREAAAWIKHLEASGVPKGTIPDPSSVRQDQVIAGLKLAKKIIQDETRSRFYYSGWEPENKALWGYKEAERAAYQKRGGKAVATQGI